MSALNNQVGGSHYKDCAIQPIEYITKNGLGFIEGNIVKYITRWREKGGIQDLEKVRHYVDLLIELEGSTPDPTANPDGPTSMPSPRTPITVENLAKHLQDKPVFGFVITRDYKQSWEASSPFSFISLLLNVPTKSPYYALCRDPDLMYKLTKSVNSNLRIYGNNWGHYGFHAIQVELRSNDEKDDKGNS